jgi:hypothetical protein
VKTLSKDERIKKKVEKDSKRTLFEKIIHYIPIYHGYKVKENRREADKILREHISNDFDKMNNKLKNIRDTFVEEEIQELWKPIEKSVSLCEMMIQKIRYADYGYAGFFDKVKINENELDRMYEFDASLLDDVNTIREVINDLELGADNPDITLLKKKIKGVQDVLEQLEEKFAKREEYMLNFTD